MEPYKVLLADDEEDIRVGISQKMDWAELGLTLVGEADNGKDALELAESLLRDVVLTDSKMPFLDGRELCRILTEQLPASTGPEVSFAGRSNVGKSSLLNKLMYRKGLAKVSSTPGKTATINFYDVDGHDLVDLPGYGYANVTKAEKGRWSELIEGYYNQDRDFALVVSLIDIRHEPSALDRNMVQFLMDAELPFAIALTKADKLTKQQQMKQRAAIKKALKLPGGVPMVVTSSEKGDGIDELRALINRAIER